VRTRSWRGGGGAVGDGKGQQERAGLNAPLTSAHCGSLGAFVGGLCATAVAGTRLQPPAAPRPPAARMVLGRYASIAASGTPGVREPLAPIRPLPPEGEDGLELIRRLIGEPDAAARGVAESCRQRRAWRDRRAEASPARTQVAPSPLRRPSLRLSRKAGHDPTPSARGQSYRQRPALLGRQTGNRFMEVALDGFDRV
jgi:hypothetical protein